MYSIFKGPLKAEWFKGSWYVVKSILCAGSTIGYMIEAKGAVESYVTVDKDTIVKLCENGQIINAKAYTRNGNKYMRIREITGVIRLKSYEKKGSQYIMEFNITDKEQNCVGIVALKYTGEHIMIVGSKCALEMGKNNSIIGMNTTYDKDGKEVLDITPKFPCIQMEDIKELREKHKEIGEMGQCVVQEKE